MGCANWACAEDNLVRKRLTSLAVDLVLDSNCAVVFDEHTSGVSIRAEGEVRAVSRHRQVTERSTPSDAIRVVEGQRSDATECRLMGRLSLPKEFTGGSDHIAFENVKGSLIF